MGFVIAVVDVVASAWLSSLSSTLPWLHFLVLTMYPGFSAIVYSFSSSLSSVSLDFLSILWRGNYSTIAKCPIYGYFGDTAEIKPRPPETKQDV